MTTVARPNPIPVCRIVWAKTNGKPESVRDRPTRNHEYLFLLSKRRHHHVMPRQSTANAAASSGTSRATEPQRPPRRRPDQVIQPCVIAAGPEGGTVLDPFAGTGTTGLVALRNRRSFIRVELNPHYAHRPATIELCPAASTITRTGIQTMRRER